MIIIVKARNTPTPQLDTLPIRHRKMPKSPIVSTKHPYRQLPKNLHAFSLSGMTNFRSYSTLPILFSDERIPIFIKVKDDQSQIKYISILLFFRPFYRKITIPLFYAEYRLPLLSINEPYVFIILIFYLIAFFAFYN